MILTINSGSSSIKFTLFPAGGEPGRGMVLYNGQIDGIGDEPRFVAVDSIGHQIDYGDEDPGATLASNCRVDWQIGIGATVYAFPNSGN